MARWTIGVLLLSSVSFVNSAGVPAGSRAVVMDPDSTSDIKNGLSQNHNNLHQNTLFDQASTKQHLNHIDTSMTSNQNEESESSSSSINSQSKIPHGADSDIDSTPESHATNKGSVYVADVSDQNSVGEATVHTTTPVYKHSTTTAQQQSSSVPTESPATVSETPQFNTKSSFSFSKLLRSLTSSSLNSRGYELESRSDEQSRGGFDENSQQQPPQGKQSSSSNVMSDMDSAFPGMFNQMSSSQPVSFTSSPQPTVSVSQGVQPGKYF